MLDLEVVSPPTQTGLDIITRAEMKRALRIRSANTTFDEDIDALIKQIAGGLHGRSGLLNRTIFPMTWIRYLRVWPVHNADNRRIIKLPFGPVNSVLSIAYEDGSSPLPEIDADDYVFRKNDYEAEIEFKTGVTLPTPDLTPRAIAVTYTAGYSSFPHDLKRLISILVAHAFENPEATINEPRQMAVNRKVEYGADWLIDRLRVPVSYDDWE